MSEQKDRPEDQEEKTPVDFLVEPASEEDLEDVSGGCTNCADGCSPH